jgi:hypothetical protein
MWRTSAIVASLCVGGCFASYRSVSGRVYGPDARALDEALRDSGSTNLACDPSAIKVRRFATGRSRSYRIMLVAEGCGQRASYLTDCSGTSGDPVGGSAPAPVCPAPFGSLDSTCDDYREAICELVLISKVRLD